MAKSLNEAQLGSASGGVIRNASKAEANSLGGAGIVAEGIMKNGKYGRMTFEGNKEGFAKAVAFTNRVGMGTDVNVAQGANGGSDVLKDIVPKGVG